MPEPKTIEPLSSFRDPREGDDFVAEHWPLCNGERLPAFGSEEADLHTRRCIEFLASYYGLNLLNARLLEARQGDASETEIRGHLDAVDAALRAHDDLEDRYAPIGFYGEPDMDGVFYRNIRINRPGLVRLRQAASQASSHIAIPGLEFLPPEELEGEVTIERWP